MTRVSLTESYDDRSVISKLNEMDKRVKENASVVTAAEESARQSAQSAQETADRFAGSVGAVVQNANAQINASKVLVNEAKSEVDATVTTVAQAVQTANNASASAQASATTVATYGTRLTAVEDKARENKASIDHLDNETLDLYNRDANNVKLHADYQQNVTGALVFNGPDKLIVKDAPNFGKSVTVRHNDVELGQPIANSRYWNEIIGIDKNGGTLWQIEYDHLSNGDANLALNLMKDDSTTKSGITITKRNDVVIPQVTNLPSGAPSMSIVNKAYVEATDETTNNLLHKTGNETRASGYINFDGTSQIYDHGRVFSGGRMDQTHFYDYCTIPASGDLRAMIEVMTLNQYGIVMISEAGGSVSKVNLIGSTLQYVDFEVETVGTVRVIRVKKMVAGDIILNGINININGVRANVKVETDYKRKVVE